MGWLESWFDKDNTYHRDLKSIKLTNTPLVDIAKRVIHDIQKNYPPPYYLMVSGGIDSQSMLWLWMNSGVEFFPITIEYTHNEEIINAYDLLEINEFSRKYDIQITSKKFDIIQFLNTDLHKYAEMYQCTSPQITAHMAMSELLTDGTVIFSGNFIHQAFYNYTILGLERYSDKSSRNIIPYFLMCDPELSVGIIQYEKDIPYVRNEIYTRKVEILHKAGIPVIPQPAKQTGFENIKTMYDNVPLSYVERIKYSSKSSKRKFDIIFRYRLQDKIIYKDDVIYHNEDNHVFFRNLKSGG